MTDHRTVEIAGFEYEIGRLDAKKQFHVARRLAPLMAGMSKVFVKTPEVLSAGPEGESMKDKLARVDLSKMAEPLAESLANMKDEDCDFIIDTCLRVCKRRGKEGSWSPVTARDGFIMYADMNASVMMGLTLNVILDSLSSFFPTAQPEIKGS